MKRTLFIVFFCSLVLQSYAFQLPYKQLTKSYAKDKDKCLSNSETFMKWFPNDPAAYYYASLIHFEKAQTQESTRKKYNELSKSLGYARKLELLKTQSFLEKVDWDTLTPHMAAFTEDIVSALEDEELYTLSSSISKKLDRFDWEAAEREQTELVASTLSDESSPENAVSTSSYSNGQYFGIPSGTEMIPSFNMNSEREMLAYINEERAKQGMKPLVWEEKLAQAARYHAFDMGSQNYFDHNSYDRLNGKLVEVGETFERIRSFYHDSFVNSENIAAGNQGAKATYSQWYNSPGHYRNLFNSESGKVGIGVCYVSGSEYGYYWVFNTAL